MEDKVKQLIQDYERRIETANQEIRRCQLNEGEKENRLNTKISAWRTFIAELRAFLHTLPLDPHTCELCVGDVVDVYWSKAESTEGVILEIDDNLNEKLRYRVFDYFYDEPVNCSRSQLTLKSNQRAGVQNGE